ncbi:5598_t:CDS:2 [Entrophospora sp. SA101]|nr:5598_t:CDS:2 [Entrophospora sp. SA101]
MKCLDKDPLKRPTSREVHDQFLHWMMMMLKQDGYYSPVNNTYWYFTDEEYEENKKLRSKFKESDKINAKAEPYVEKEKNKDAFYFSRLMNYKEQISKALGNTKQSQHEKSQELKTSDSGQIDMVIPDF